MAIRLALFGGTPWADGDILYAADLNDTFIAFYGTQMLVGMAQQAYQQLEATTFVNRDNLCAEVYTVAAGKNTTVDMTPTAAYDSTNKRYLLNYTDEASGDTTNDPDGFTNPSYAFDNNDATYANISLGAAGNKSLGKTFGSKFVGWVYYKAYFTHNNSGTITITLEKYNGATWSTETTLGTHSTSGTFTDTGSYFFNATTSGIRVKFTYAGSSGTGEARLYTLAYGNFDASASVSHTPGITLTGAEKGIVVYARKTTPANTTVTFNVTDGSTTISAQALGTLVDISTLSSGTLAIRLNLATTNTSATPLIYGYGAFLVY